MTQSNTVKRSLERIYKTFIRVKTQVFTEDKEAFKNVLNYYEETQAQIALSNLPYLKAITLLMAHYTKFTGSAKEASFLLQKDLETPLPMQVEKLRLMINNADIMEYFKSVGLDSEDNTENILKENHKEIVDKINKSYTFDKEKKSIFKTANDLQFNTKVNEF